MLFDIIIYLSVSSVVSFNTTMSNFLLNINHLGNRRYNISFSSHKRENYLEFLKVKDLISLASSMEWKRKNYIRPDTKTSTDKIFALPYNPNNGNEDNIDEVLNDFDTE